MVGLLTALPETRLYQRLMNEGRLETESTGNNTQAALNFQPRLDRDFLVDGYRELMEMLYEPRNCYQRIRTFVEYHRPQSPRLRFAWTGFQTFVKSLWLLGVGIPGGASTGSAALRCCSDGPASSTGPWNLPSWAITSVAWPARYDDLPHGFHGPFGRGFVEVP
jgi:hypothetical protein